MRATETDSTVLVLGAGKFQAPSIQRARSLGFRIVAMDQDEEAPGLAEADAGYAVDLTDVEAGVRIARKHGVDGVTTVAVEAGVVPAARIAESCGLPGPPVEAARMATDKAAMRRAFERADVPSARYRAVDSPGNGHAAAEQVGYPLVVKPPDRSGSRGVQKVEEAEDLPAALSAAFEASHGGRAILEEYLAGPEVSVEGVVRRGELRVLALSDKLRTDPPYLLDRKVAFPADIADPLRQEVVAIARSAVAALGLDTVAIHAEIKLTPTGPRMVEVAARGAGFRVFTDMLGWVTGLDMTEVLMRLVTDAPLSLTPLKSRGSVLYFPSAEPGVLREIDGLDSVSGAPGVVDFDLYVQPGDSIRPLRAGTDRIGHIVTRGTSRDQAERHLKAALAHLSLDIRPESSGYP